MNFQRTRSIVSTGLIFVGLAFAISASACSGNPVQQPASRSTQATQAVDATQPASIPATDFPHPLTIDNRWTPLVPGTASYFSGKVVEDGETHSHRVISIVTDLSKVIDGVETRVVWERDFSDDVLEESELFFAAQDSTGTVWLFGEYPATYEEGRFAGAPDTWIAGTAGAQRGTIMPAEPGLGTPTYIEGRAPSVEFDDRAKVLKVGQTVQGPSATYHDVLVIDEWSPLAPEDGHQLKYYAAGIGSVHVAARGGNSQESLSLTKVVHLTEAEMADTRNKALKLDSDAYRFSKVYAATPRAVQTP